MGQAILHLDLDPYLFHVTLLFVVPGGAGMQRDLVPVPNRVDVIGEVQVSPLQQLLLFVNAFATAYANSVGMSARPLNRRTRAHDRWDGSLDTAV